MPNNKMSKHKWSNFYHHMTTINPESIWTLINLPKHSSQFITKDKYEYSYYHAPVKNRKSTFLRFSLKLTHVFLNFFFGN